LLPYIEKQTKSFKNQDMLQIAFIREKKEKAARLKTLVAKMNQQKNNEQTIET
jgi:hypothetical protein